METIKQLNEFGKRYGYPFYVFDNGDIKKDLLDTNPFKFIVTGLLDEQKSLRNQAIMRYETWLRAPSSPSSPKLPEELSIPAYLKPKIYSFPKSNATVYAYAEPKISCLYKIVPDTENFRVVFFAPHMQVKQVNMKEKNGEIKVFVYIFRV
ncbi:MAG: hypothetical protein J6J35_06560 [Alphaproteobacteria bacterium]|nr:hypothetical protein [Alphaproteobacteria bacterium]